MVESFHCCCILTHSESTQAYLDPTMARTGAGSHGTWAHSWGTLPLLPLPAHILGTPPMLPPHLLVAGLLQGGLWNCRGCSHLHVGGGLRSHIALCLHFRPAEGLLEPSEDPASQSPSGSCYRAARSCSSTITSSNSVGMRERTFLWAEDMELCQSSPRTHWHMPPTR